MTDDWYGALLDADARHDPAFERHYGEQPAKCALTLALRSDGVFFHMQDRAWKVVHGGVEQDKTFPCADLQVAEQFAKELRWGPGVRTG